VPSLDRRNLVRVLASAIAGAAAGIAVSRVVAIAEGLVGPSGYLPTPPGQEPAFVALFMLVAGLIVAPSIRRIYVRRSWTFAVLVAAGGMGAALQEAPFSIARAIWRGVDPRETDLGLLVVRAVVFGLVGGTATLLAAILWNWVMNTLGVRTPRRAASDIPER
jgi:hypothetical protein